MRKGILSTIVCVMVAVGLLACGGDGGTDTSIDTGPGSNTNAAPVAHAGPDQNVSTGSVVTLNGSGSSDANGDTLTYSWSFTSKPANSTATLSSASIVNPMFTADKAGVYVLSLVANDGTVNSAADSVTITAATGSPAPVANAGPDRNVITGSVVTLNGNGLDMVGNGLSYSWSFISKPDGSTAMLDIPTVYNPQFTADLDGSYVLSLVVNDGQVNSAPDSVTIIATTAPVANAGPDQNVPTGSLVTLDGSGSSDANSDTLTYSWSFTSKPAGSAAVLSSATVVNPTFTADKDGAYVLRLVVNDGMVNSAADSVTIIAATNSAPVADAGTDRNVATGSLVTLDGSGSSDADGDTLTYSWTFISKPDGSTAALSSTSAVKPTFIADNAGSYLLSMVVSDGLVSSAADTVTVTAVNTVPVFVPDTGQTTGYTATFGEDPDYNINTPSYTDNGNETITDNVTGLIWQKQDDDTTRTWDDANTYCSNNAPGLPGTGWRLPTLMELSGIINYETSGAAINTTYFPGTNASFYWSSDTFAGNTTDAWHVRFDIGFLNFDSGNKTNPHYVRCVSGQSTTSGFTDNGNGTTTDIATSLMWQREDDGTKRAWEEAISYCENLSLATHDDWRLPNIKELSSLIDVSRYMPAIDPVFTGAKSSTYWSSTHNADYLNFAWDLTFYYGQTSYYYPTEPQYVRCVRGGQ